MTRSDKVSHKRTDFTERKKKEAKKKERLHCRRLRAQEEKEEYIEKCWGTPVDDDLRLYLGKDANITRASEFYHTNYINFIGHCKLFPGAIEVLKFVKNKGFKTAVVTNTHHELTIKILKKFNLINYFDAVLGGDDVKSGKPDPEIIIKACNLLCVFPGDSVMVGDTNADMEAGKSAGCFTIGVGVRGDVKIEKLSELFEILR